MQCNEIRNYLADYLAEDLSNSMQEEFSRHLNDCSECRFELEALTDLWVKLGSVPAGEPASPDLEVRLRASAEVYQAEVRDSGKGRRVWKRLPAVAVIVAAIAVAVLVPARMLQHAPALLEDRKIEFGEIVRSGNAAGRALVLADSSRVEMRAKSELLLERADDGVRILLRKGSVLVTAAKQHNGHLYVQTKDVMVSVVGTVFLVNAEEEGSRVAVIEGEVRVKQGTTERSLRKGEHVATNPSMETSLVSKEREWSPEAETQLAAVQRGAVPSPIVPVSRKEKFEVASIRLKPTVDGGRGNGPRGNACGNPRVSTQIDPHRLSISGLSLNNLIALAYSEWTEPRGGRSDFGCQGVTAGGMLSGGADWVRSDLWEIQATIPEGLVEYKVTHPLDGLTVRGGRALPDVTAIEDLGPRVRGMLQNLLADRFQLVLRSQTKDMPVYLLTVGKDGFKPNENLRPGPPQPDRWTKILVKAGYFRLGVAGESMPKIATILIPDTERPVLDRTNLAGTFDFHIEYDNRGVSDRPSLFKAIEEVGLKLEPSRAPVEVWVIERAERPSEN